MSVEKELEALTVVVNDKVDSLLTHYVYVLKYYEY